MSNPLFDMLGGGAPSGPFGNIAQLAGQFQQFRNGFRGDARQQVQELLNSGRVTQAQYDNAVRLAQQLQRIVGK